MVPKGTFPFSLKKGIMGNEFASGRRGGRGNCSQDVNKKNYYKKREREKKQKLPANTEGQ